MQKKQVAVLDFGSSAVTALVAERGINKTFIIKGKYSFEYDGYGEGAFLDERKLSSVIKEAVKCIRQTLKEEPKTVYVGVPGDFCSVLIRDSQISFEKKKKIDEADISALFDSAFVTKKSNSTLINRSAIVYELDDFRRLANPYGAFSEILKGKLSFVLCSNYFIETVSSVIKECGIEDVEYVSVPLAEAMYLIDAETRDRITLLADVGYISTTLSIIQGDGIVCQGSFPFGGGFITGKISERYGIDFQTAEKIKRKINLTALNITDIDVIDGEDGNYYSVKELKETVIEMLDVLAEQISEFIENCGYTLPEYVPLTVTGGGITFLRGAKEHLSSRLDMSVSVVTPSVPMMNNPTLSSMLSVLDMALGQVE